MSSGAGGKDNREAPSSQPCGCGHGGSSGSCSSGKGLSSR